MSKNENSYLLQMREEYPEYAEVDDVTLAKAYGKKHYADVDESEFLQKVGLGEATSDEPNRFEKQLNDAREFVGLKKTEPLPQIDEIQPTENFVDLTPTHLQDQLHQMPQTKEEAISQTNEHFRTTEGEKALNEFRAQDKPLQDTTLDFAFPAIGKVRAMQGGVAKGLAKTKDEALQADKMIATGNAFAKGDIVGNVVAQAAMKAAEENMDEGFKQEYPLLSTLIPLVVGVGAGGYAGYKAEKNVLQKYNNLANGVKSGDIKPQEAEEILKEENFNVDEFLNQTKQPKVSQELEIDKADEGFIKLQEEIIGTKPKPEVAEEAPTQTQDVVEEAPTQTQDVVEEAPTQAQDVVEEAPSQLADEMPVPKVEQEVELTPWQELQKLDSQIKENNRKASHRESIDDVDGAKVFRDEEAVLTLQAQTVKNKIAEELYSHPRAEELLSMRENVSAKDAEYANIQTQKGKGRELDGLNGTDKHTYDKAQYEKNYNHDFELTKQDVAKIRSGKIDDDLLAKLEADLGTLDNHPDYAPTSPKEEVMPTSPKEEVMPTSPKEEVMSTSPIETPQEQIKPKEMSDDDWLEANALFSKGVDNVAVGVYAGVGEDENGNITFDPEKFVLGLGGYTAVKKALKNGKVQGVLKEYAQKAIDTVDMNPQVQKENGLNAMFVGTKNKDLGAFSDMATKKTMNEIDDSKASVKATPKELNNQKDTMHWDNLTSIKEQYDNGSFTKDEAMKLFEDTKSKMSNGATGTHQLDDVLEHKELFAEYPKLSETKVSFVEMPKNKSGYFDAKNNEIVVNANSSNEEIKDILLHEIQHSVQKQEGWAKGGSAENMSAKDLAETIQLKYGNLPAFEKIENDFLDSKIATEDEMYAKIINIAKDNYGGIDSLKHDTYKRLLGEQQARATQYRAKMTPEQKASETWQDTLKRVEWEYKEPVIRFDDGVSEMSESQLKTFDEKVKQIKADIKSMKLDSEQKSMAKVYAGEIDVVKIKSHDIDTLKDYVHLEKGTKTSGAKKIITKHYGNDSSSLTTAELFEMMEVIKVGKVKFILDKNKKPTKRREYTAFRDGVRYKAIIDEDRVNGNDFVLSYYTNRKKGAGSHNDTPSTPFTDTIIPQDTTNKKGLLESKKMLAKYKAGKLENVGGLPDETKLGLMQRKMQDKFNRVKQLINAKSDINKIDDAMNPYQAEENMHGRVGAKIDEFENEIFNPIIEKISRGKVFEGTKDARAMTTDDVDLYLWARHAPERNAKMLEKRLEALPKSEMDDVQADVILNRYKGTDIEAVVKAVKKDGEAAHLGRFTHEDIEAYIQANIAKEINKNIAKTKEQFSSLSGMTDTEAYEIIKRYATSESMQDIASDVYNMNRDRLKYIYKEGLEDAEFIKFIDENYDNYVPLRREFADNEAMAKGAKGFDINGKEFKKAKGSQRKVESPLLHSALAYQETIMRAEKNRVGQAFLNFVEAFPDETLYSISKVKKTPKIDGETGSITSDDSLTTLKDHVLHVKVDGKVKQIVIKDKQLATAMKNLNSEQLSGLMKVSHSITRFIASVNTMYNPEFVVSNFERDIQSAMINLPNEVKKNRLTILKDVPSAMKAIYKQNRKFEGADEWRELFSEMKKEGGTTGWSEMYSVTNLNKSTKDMIAKHQGKLLPKESFKSVLKYIDDVNDMVENSTRLVAYKMAKESGLSNAKAANIAKNLTVNFNKKGEAGTTMNALFMFYNASVQGSVRLAKALATSKKAQGIAVGIGVTGYLLDKYNRSVNSDAYELIPDYVKDTNYILMNEDGTYQTVKLPYGYNVFKGMGDMVGTLEHGELTADKMASRIFSMMVNAFSPVGVDSEDMLHTVMPTVVKPFYEIEKNTNFFGGNIAPEQNPFKPETADAGNYYKSVNPVALSIAQNINDWTGGTLHASGKIDVSPETIEYLGEFATGGLGKLISRSITVGDQVINDEEVDMNKVPFSRLFYAVPRERAEVNKIYKLYNESGKTLFTPLEQRRFLKWTDIAKDKKHIDIKRSVKIKRDFRQNQALLEFLDKFDIQNANDFTTNPKAIREAKKVLTYQQRKELKEQK